ncbi:MAG: lipid A-modifier LpxR family protein [Planctomycetota bacterium]
MTRVLRPVPLLLIPLALFAQSGPEDDWFSLYFDNDYFAGRDDHYTAGITIGWNRYRYKEDSGRADILHLSVNYRMFTPDNIAEMPVPENDQPYAALAYASASGGRQSNTQMIAWTVQAGIMGPAAQAEDIQKWAHTTFGGKYPRGWHTQFDNQALGNCWLEHRARPWRTQITGDWQFEGMTAISIGLGTIATASRVGLGLRTGWRLPWDFRVTAPLLGDVMLGQADLQHVQEMSLTSYLFADATAFAHVAPWDGDLFRSNDGIEYDPYQYRGIFGIRLQAPRWSLGTEIIAITLPYEPPDGIHLESYWRIELGFRL